MKLYIAGPMRGYDRFNFDAFEAACLDLERRGYSVISPHRMDLEAGFDPCGTLDGFDLHGAIRRDIEAIIATDAIALLPGWESSMGAKAEKSVAEWLDRLIFLYPTMEALDNGNTR